MDNITHLVFLDFINILQYTEPIYRIQIQLWLAETFNFQLIQYLQLLRLRPSWLPKSNIFQTKPITLSAICTYFTSSQFSTDLGISNIFQTKPIR